MAAALEARWLVPGFSVPLSLPWVSSNKVNVGALVPSHAPGVTRTRGQQFRKLLLYPSELRGLTSGAGCGS